MVTEKVRENIENLNIRHEHPNIQGQLTVSIGVASTIPSQHKMDRHILEEADKNLYRAKKMGRNQLFQAYRRVTGTRTIYLARFVYT